MSYTDVVSFVFKGTNTDDEIREIAEGVGGDYVIDAANVVIKFMECIDRDKISQVGVTLERWLEDEWGYACHEWRYTLTATFTTLNGKTFEYCDKQNGCSCHEFECWN
jgi:hypothetical protein